METELRYCFTAIGFLEISVSEAADTPGNFLTNWSPVLAKRGSMSRLETIEPLRAARAFSEKAAYDVVERFGQSDPDVYRFRYRKPL